jgi:hypothetical protein
MRIWSAASRDVAVVLGTVAVTLFLTACLGYLIVRSDDAKLLAHGMRAAYSNQPIPPEQERAFWRTLERAHFKMTWLLLPMVALLAGSVGGVLSRRHAWQRAAVGVVPFAFTFTIPASKDIVKEILFFALYVGLAGVAGGAGGRIHMVATRGRPTTR